MCVAHSIGATVWLPSGAAAYTHRLVALVLCKKANHGTTMSSKVCLVMNAEIERRKPH